LTTSAGYDGLGRAITPQIVGAHSIDAVSRSYLGVTPVNESSKDQ